MVVSFDPQMQVTIVNIIPPATSTEANAIHTTPAVFAALKIPYRDMSVLCDKLSLAEFNKFNFFKKIQITYKYDRRPWNNN